MTRRLSVSGVFFVIALFLARMALATPHHYLYVAVPVVAEDATTDAVSLLAFDIDHGYRFVRRTRVWTRADDDETVRAIVRGAGTTVYVSTTHRLGAIDIRTGTILWQQNYGGHCCEEIALSPDGRLIYVPAFERPVWFIVKSATGELLRTISVVGWPRRTVVSLASGKVYLGIWETNRLGVLDPEARTVARQLGPFGGFVCPFTLNRKGTLAFVNVDGLVGFEVVDLNTGLLLDRVSVDAYSAEQLKQYECPSHGIAFTPDEKELWVADGVGNQLRIFDAVPYPPVAIRAIQLARQPRGVTFSADGRYAYTSTGEVIDVVAKMIAAVLRDEHGEVVESGRMIELVTEEQDVAADR
jgi:DNA-binding beta-propeller fold protein YncE